MADLRLKLTSRNSPSCNCAKAKSLAAWKRLETCLRTQRSPGEIEGEADEANKNHQYRLQK